MSTALHTSLQPSIQIVQRVAAAKGVAQEELSPLYETIDTDALDAVLRSDRDDNAGIGHVQFQYEGYTIVAASDGQIELTDDDI